MLTPGQQAKMRQKIAAAPDALKRDPLSDYREGWFFVTLNTHGGSLLTMVGLVIVLCFVVYIAVPSIYYGLQWLFDFFKQQSGGKGENEGL